MRPSSCPRWSGRSHPKGGTQMRKFLLIVGTLIILALGGLEVIAARNLAVTEELSEASAGLWK